MKILVDNLNYRKVDAFLALTTNLLLITGKTSTAFL